MCMKYNGSIIEGFESGVANSVSVIEQKLNDTFNFIDDNTLKTSKNLQIDGNGINTNWVEASGDINAGNFLNSNKGLCVAKTCVKSLKPVEAIRMTKCDIAVGHQLEYLDRQNVSCEADEYLAGFHFVHEGCPHGQMRYKYKCRKLPT